MICADTEPSSVRSRFRYIPSSGPFIWSRTCSISTLFHRQPTRSGDRAAVTFRTLTSILRLLWYIPPGRALPASLILLLSVSLPASALSTTHSLGGASHAHSRLVLRRSNGYGVRVPLVHSSISLAFPAGRCYTSLFASSLTDSIQLRCPYFITRSRTSSSSSSSSYSSSNPPMTTTSTNHRNSTSTTVPPPLPHNPNSSSDFPTAPPPTLLTDPIPPHYTASHLEVTIPGRRHRRLHLSFPSDHIETLRIATSIGLREHHLFRYLPESAIEPCDSNGSAKVRTENIPSDSQ